MHNKKWKFLSLIKFPVYRFSISYIHIYTQRGVCNGLPLIVIPVMAILVGYLKLATSLLVYVASMNEKEDLNVKFSGINFSDLLL